MRRLSIIEYANEVIVEIYNQETKVGVEYWFASGNEAIEAIPNIDAEQHKRG